MKKTQDVETLGERVCADIERLHARWMNCEKRLRKHRRRRLRQYLCNGGWIYEVYLEMKSYAALDDFLTASLNVF
ncbi:hypothetical protein [Runella slithyformis]|uniref:Uncharacterized protein n=1 Tax=Runella slithyformis (strain ATCC 29530 / DSM 19594 / LMG 11500 / NCIMB 11436 / LSU 4) TaxID=761193 RepID=A0A7U3ZGL2_RUNSL|nr:hypothetical protein [Runella slithyformis]AEI46762.1 hypothetical protein Runsl_0310 [Runella slithyformis DSM 19594]